ncbi:MAG: LysR family transcriptional regulator [Bdellovibrionales bacterium]|nr:LysR family transcriptional regulator [Bdellovibrionales bacterium]
MTQTQIEYILAVFREKSFVRAAETCHVTQPTLSAQIQKLEESLGVKIFDRSKSPVRPTRVGELILEQAKLAHQEFLKISLIADEEKGSVKGDFYLATIPTISPYLMPRLLVPLRKNYVDLSLNVFELTTENALIALDEERVDLVILATKEDPKKYKQTIVGRESMYLYSQNSEPVIHSRKFSLKDLRPESMWLLEEGHCLREEILDACKIQKQSNIRPQNMTFKTGSMDALINLVDEFGGYTFIPEMAAAGYAGKLKGTLTPLESKDIYREIYITTRRSNLKRNVVQIITEITRQILSK